MALPLQPAHVTAETKHWGRSVPMLDLSGSVLLPFRVYVLRCARRHTGGPPTLYVGVEHRSNIARRVQSHFIQRGAHFTLAHKPVDVAVAWPVASAQLRRMSSTHSWRACLCVRLNLVAWEVGRRRRATPVAYRPSCCSASGGC